MTGIGGFRLADAPGYIGLATAAGFTGSVVGNWIYFQAWDPQAFKLLTPGDFSTLAVPLIVFVAPATAFAAILYAWLISFGARRFLRQAQPPQAPVTTTAAPLPAYIDETTLIGRIQSAAITAAWRPLVRLLRILGEKTFLIFIALLYLFLALISPIIFFVGAHNFFYQNVLSVTSSVVQLMLIAIAIPLFFGATYVGLSALAWVFRLSLASRFLNRAITLMAFSAFLLWFFGFLYVSQTSRFYNSFSNALNAGDQRCLFTADAVRNSSDCLLLSLERGIMFYDSHDQTLKFRFHNDGLIVDLRTPRTIPETWESVESTKFLRESLTLVDSIPILGTMAQISAQATSNNYACQEEFKEIENKQERTEKISACIDNKRAERKAQSTESAASNPETDPSSE